MTQVKVPVPPQSPEAEAALLGALLVRGNDAVAEVRDAVEVADFALERNRLVYGAIVAVWGKGNGVNAVTVGRELEEKGTLATVTQKYLSGLAQGVLKPEDAASYARTVKACSLNRRLIDVGRGIAALGYEGGEPEENLAHAATMVLSLMDQARERQGFRSMREIADSYLDEFNDWLENPEKPRGLGTGFADLDKTIDGLEAGKLVLVGGRPGMGKTMFVENVAQAVARQGKAVAMFSLEQSAKGLFQRLVVKEAGVDRANARVRGLTEDDKRRLWDAFAAVGELSVWIDDTPGIQTVEARARTLALKVRLGGIGLVVFDYIDLAGDYAPDEIARRGKVVKALRLLAREANVPVLACVQLNREVEKRPDRRPQLADLRQSGELEQVADVVLLLFRQDYYRRKYRPGEPRVSGREWAVEDMDQRHYDPKLEGVLLVHVAKNKDGPATKVRVVYREQTGFMGDLATEGA